MDPDHATLLGDKIHARPRETGRELHQQCCRGLGSTNIFTWSVSWRSVWLAELRAEM